MLEAIAAAVTILGALAAFTKWGRSQCRRAWRLFTRFRPKVPRETLRIIPDQHRNWWCVGSCDGEAGMQINFTCLVTNISDCNIMVWEVTIKKPNTLGHVLLYPPLSNGYGTNWIPPGRTLKGTADFWIRPVLCQENQAFIADIDFLDQFGNRHRVREVRFRPEPGKRTAPAATPTTGDGESEAI